jgi:hypothetical protein
MQFFHFGALDVQMLGRTGQVGDQGIAGRRQMVAESEHLGELPDDAGDQGVGLDRLGRTLSIIERTLRSEKPMLRRRT